jgi:hypothetical protein
MATQISATNTRTRPAPRVGGLQVAILGVIAAAVIAVGVWSLAGSIGTATIDNRTPVGTYPLHGGLAGPSQVGQAPVVDQAGNYGSGYPFHGGLAGPSQVGEASTVDVASQYGPGYELHGGLAGPSQVENGN